MSVDFLIQLCAHHGIKLALSADGSNRLLVDAPKGALTSSLREALTAHKSELIAALKTQKQTESQRWEAETSLKTDNQSQTTPDVQKERCATTGGNIDH